MSSLLPYFNRLKIITKKRRIVPFDLNWAQAQYLDAIEQQAEQGRPERVIVLKARQMGISTLTEGYIFLRSLIAEHQRGMVVSHNKDSSKHLLSITRTFWNSYPFKAAFTPRRLSRTELGWEEVDSELQISTAKNLDPGRSMTLTLVHGSEVALWPHGEVLMGGLVDSVPDLPGTFICLESTARGVGNYFHKEWVAAEAGDSEFVPLFFPWWKHYEYCASYIGLPQESLKLLSPEERVLRKSGVDDDHLAWRRWVLVKKYRNDLDFFHQEHPATSEEAFISTGRNVFPYQKVMSCFHPIEGGGLVGRLEGGIDGNPVKFVPDAFGPLTLYRKPSRRQPYLVGGDPTRTVLGDPACAQVINRVTFEQVATWHGRIDAVHFADELVKLGRYFNDALLAPESTGPGQSTIGALLHSGYEYIYQRQAAERLPGEYQQSWGWDTSHKTKYQAIGGLLGLLIDDDVVFHDKGTKEELITYVTRPNGEMGPADEDSQYDDRVMALAIAVAANRAEGPQYQITRVDDPEEPQWMRWVQDVTNNDFEKPSKLQFDPIAPHPT